MPTSLKKKTPLQTPKTLIHDTIYKNNCSQECVGWLVAIDVKKNTWKCGWI